MSNVKEISHEMWNGLKRDCDAMAEHMIAARSYWPVIATRMASLRTDHKSDIEFGGAIAAHGIHMNPHNQAAMIEMGKWTPEYLADCMDNCERSSPRRFVELVLTWGEPKLVGMVAYQTDKEKPKTAPDDPIAEEKSKSNSHETKKTTGRPTKKKTEADSAAVKLVKKKAIEANIHTSLSKMMKDGVEVAPELAEHIVFSKYDGCNTDIKNKVFSPQILFPGVPRKFAEKFSVDMTNAYRTLRANFEKNIISNIDKFIEIEEELKKTGVHLGSRTGAEQAARVFAGKPAEIKKAVVVSPTDHMLLGKILWPVKGIEDSEQNRQTAECAIAFAVDWDLSLCGSNKNAKGRGVIINTRARSLRGASCPIVTKMLSSYATVIMGHDFEQSPREYASTLPSSGGVKAKYGL